MSQIVLLASIVIRLLAFGWSVVLVRRFRDWRLVLLSAVLALMVVRHTLSNRWVREEWPGIEDLASVVPAIFVSIGLLIAVVLIGRMIDDYRAVLDQAAASSHPDLDSGGRLG